MQDVLNHARASLGLVFILSQPLISVDARSLKICKNLKSYFHFSIDYQNGSGNPSDH